MGDCVRDCVRKVLCFTEALLKLLEHKGNVPTELRKKILAVTEIDRLDELFDCAVGVSSVEEFEQKMV